MFFISAWIPLHPADAFTLFTFSNIPNSSVNSKRRHWPYRNPFAANKTWLFPRYAQPAHLPMTDGRRAPFPGTSDSLKKPNPGDISPQFSHRSYFLKPCAPPKMVGVLPPFWHCQGMHNPALLHTIVYRFDIFSSATFTTFIAIKCRFSYMNVLGNSNSNRPLSGLNRQPPHTWPMTADDDR